MKTLFSFFLLIMTLSVCAQSSEPILTKEQNASWIAEFEQQEMEEKLETIRKRWLEDLDVYFTLFQDPHGKKSIREEEIKKSYKYQSRCRPLYFFRTAGEAPVFLPPNASEEMISEVSKIVNPKNISEVQVETGVKMQALYGTRASCGVIFLEVPEKDIFEKLASELQVQ